eukprot:GHVL01014577.1.p1 GENE.GHVL01014577.1~~GHVL01014577.1.p1  ORF type:complete len:151 (+),score=25.54 GHVL01014577.1:115-567(+)
MSCETTQETYGAFYWSSQPTGLNPDQRARHSSLEKRRERADISEILNYFMPSNDPVDGFEDDCRGGCLDDAHCEGLHRRPISSINVDRKMFQASLMGCFKDYKELSPTRSIQNREYKQNVTRPRGRMQVFRCVFSNIILISIFLWYLNII